MVRLLLPCAIEPEKVFDGERRPEKGSRAPARRSIPLKPPFGARFALKYPELLNVALVPGENNSTFGENNPMNCPVGYVPSPETVNSLRPPVASESMVAIPP